MEKEKERKKKLGYKQVSANMLRCKNSGSLLVGQTLTSNLKSVVRFDLDK